MGAIELCYHAEVRDTAPLSSKLKSEGLQCAAILDSAKRIIGDRRKAEQAEANQKAERDRRLAVTRKREADQQAEKDRLAAIERKQQAEQAQRAAAARAERDRLAAFDRQRQAQQAQLVAEQRRLIAEQKRAMESERRANALTNFSRGLQQMDRALNPQPSYAPPANTGTTCSFHGNVMHCN